MKKIKKWIALLLGVATCSSFAACGDSADYDYYDTWQVLALYDHSQPSANKPRIESVVTGGLDINDGELGRFITYTYDKKAKPPITLTYTVDGEVDTLTAYNLNYIKYKSTINGQVFTKKYGHDTYLGAPIGESLMLFNSQSLRAYDVLLRRSSLEGSMEPVSKLLGDSTNELYTLDAIVGEYASTRVGSSTYFDVEEGEAAFSTAEGANSLSIAKDGETIKFTDGANAVWSVESVAPSIYFEGGIQVDFTNGEAETLIITIMEVTDSTITYLWNDAAAPQYLCWGGRYGILEKK